MAKTFTGKIEGVSKPSSSNPLNSKAPQGLGINTKPVFSNEYLDTKKISFLEADPERYFNKSKAIQIGRFSKEGAEINTDDLSVAMDAKVNGGTIREHLANLPEAERKEYYRQLGREYYSAVREPVNMGASRYVTTSLIGAGVGDLVSRIGTALAVPASSLAGKPLKLGPKRLTAINLGAAAVGALTGAVMTPALIKREKRMKERGVGIAKGMIEEGKTAADSKETVKAILLAGTLQGGRFCWPIDWSRCVGRHRS
jgi:hypothetical protein